MILKGRQNLNTYIQDKPNALLEHVERLTHTPEWAKYPPLMLIKVLLSFLKVRQGDKEELLEYVESFQAEGNNVLRLVGNKLTDSYFEETAEYKALTTDDN